MDFRMLLYMTLVSSGLLITRYLTTGPWWFRWQLSAALLCLVTSVVGLTGTATNACLAVSLAVLISGLAGPLLLKRYLDAHPQKLSALRLLRFFIPGPPGRFQEHMYRAFAFALFGDWPAAEASFAAAASMKPPLSFKEALESTRFQVFAYARKWRSLLDYYEGLSDCERRGLGPVAMMWLARAKIETGSIADGLALTEQALENPKGLNTVFLARLNCLSAAALSGDLTGTERVLSWIGDSLGPLAGVIRLYWLGRCHHARCEFHEAVAMYDAALNALEKTPSDLWKQAVRQRKAEAFTAADDEERTNTGLFSAECTNDLSAALDRIQASASRMDKAAVFIERSGTPVCRILVYFLVAVWLGQEAIGGSLDSDTLANAGAFVPRLVLSGEWFRLVSAVFLHAGLLHLLFNILGLHLFGPALEKELGGGTFFGLFLVSGVAGNAAGLFTHRHMIAVGASGGVMGILGATLVLLLTSTWRGMEQERRRYLRDLFLLVLVNTGIGFVEAQVFNAAHIGGLLVGAAITALLLLPRPLFRKILSGLTTCLGLAGLVYGISGAVPGWLRPRTKLSSIRCRVPGGAWSVEIPGHWFIDRTDNLLTTVADDRTFIYFRPLENIPPGMPDKDVLRLLARACRQELVQGLLGGTDKFVTPVECLSSRVARWTFSWNGQSFTGRVHLVGGKGELLLVCSTIPRVHASRRKAVLKIIEDSIVPEHDRSHR